MSLPLAIKCHVNEVKSVGSLGKTGVGTGKRRVSWKSLFLRVKEGGAKLFLGGEERESRVGERRRKVRAFA